MRRADRTPPAIFLAVLTMTVLTCGAVGALGYLYLVVLGSVRSDQENASRELAGLIPQAQYSDALDKEKAEYERRSKAIAGIAESRMSWTQKLDRLANIIHGDGTTERHMVWLDSIKVDMNTTRDRGLEIKGFSGTDDLKKLSDFHKDLSHDAEFFAQFVKITDPEGKLEKTEGVLPEEAFGFDFKMALADKTPTTPAKGAKAPPAQPPAQRPSGK
jgi:Tfp pilus assembly protein PilN